jgi:hypothetical protein
MRPTILIALLAALLVTACTPDGPALHGLLDVDSRDSVAYTFHADGRLSGSNAAQPVTATTTIDGEIVMRVDSVGAGGLVWVYTTPRLVVRSKMAGTPDLADSTPVAPVRFVTDRGGRPIGRDSLGINLGGIGMMVHGDVRTMFLPAQIGSRKQGESWSDSRIDTVHDGPLPGINHTTRTYTYDGLVDTLGGSMARITSKTTIITEPLAPNDTVGNPIRATTTTIAHSYYAIDDGLLRLIRSESSIGIRPLAADPASPPAVTQTLSMLMTRKERP